MTFRRIEAALQIHWSLLAVALCLLRFTNVVALADGGMTGFLRRRNAKTLTSGADRIVSQIFPADDSEHWERILVMSITVKPAFPSTAPFAPTLSPISPPTQTPFAPPTPSLTSTSTPIDSPSNPTPPPTPLPVPPLKPTIAPSIPKPPPSAGPVPTSKPTVAPAIPTVPPTTGPVPTSKPTLAPSMPTSPPTAGPVPTTNPTVAPTSKPTVAPAIPTAPPTTGPVPTSKPTVAPSMPTSPPTAGPVPTTNPTVAPSIPTSSPTAGLVPTKNPTPAPTLAPVTVPSQSPTPAPTPSEMANSCVLDAQASCTVMSGDSCSSLQRVPESKLTCRSRPTELGWLYTGDNCLVSNNAQTGFKCEDFNGGPSSSTRVYMTVSGATSGTEYFSGVLFREGSGIGNNLPSQTFIMKNMFMRLDRFATVNITRDDEEGEILQTMIVPTSCDVEDSPEDNLFLGKMFGSIELDSYRNEMGFATASARVRWDYIAVNDGGVDAMILKFVTITHDQMEEQLMPPDLVLQPGEDFQVPTFRTVSLIESGIFVGAMNVTAQSPNGDECSDSASSSFEII